VEPIDILRNLLDDLVDGFLAGSPVFQFSSDKKKFFIFKLRPEIGNQFFQQLWVVGKIRLIRLSLMQIRLRNGIFAHQDFE